MLEYYINGQKYTLDPTKEPEKVDSLIETLVNSIKTPTFHVGNLENDIINGKDYAIADSFGFNIERNRFDSQGSGVFTSSNLADVLDWKRERSKENLETDRFNLYLIDLSPYQDNALTFHSDNESDRYSEMLEKINLNILSSIDNKHKGLTLTDIYNQHNDFFKKYNIAFSDFSSWRIKEFLRITKIYSQPEIWHKEKSINTSFAENLLKVSCVDMTKTVTDDSVARGNIIFNIDKTQPYNVCFNEHEDIAVRYFHQICDKILEVKIEFMEDIKDLPYLLFNYADCLPIKNDMDFTACEQKFKNTWKTMHNQPNMESIIFPNDTYNR